MSILTVLFISALAAYTDSSEIAVESTNYQLPNVTVPKHYDIELWTNGFEGNVSYRGLVEILVDVIQPTSAVVLHAANLTITHCKVFRNVEDGNRMALDGLKVEHISENEQMRINSGDLFQIGSYSLQLEFNGTLNATYPLGLFLTQFKDENDSERFVLASHFSPVQARRAFPCFDEPALKASFNLSIVHHKNHAAYSNMPLSRKEAIDEHSVKSTFQRTPTMSTNLLIVCTTDLLVETVGNQFALVRSSFDGKVGDSLRLSKDVLDFMDTYTGLPYLDYVPKLGHLVIPMNENQYFSAMENWGLILYLEKYYIEQTRYYDFDVNYGLHSKEVIVHEVAHQWFGNMVTPEWWYHLWLKEGFATLYQYYILDQIRPNERWMDRFLIERIPMGLEDHDGVRPISFECNSSKNITRHFNQWSYEKAAGVLNMFRNVLGNANWQKAMQIFLKSRLLNSATPEDLYSTIEAVSIEGHFFPSSHSIQEIFDSWIYPEGTVLLIVKRLQGSNKIILQQTREQYCAKSGRKTRIIPFNYAYESLPNFEETGPIYWLASNVAQITTIASYDEWIIFNKGHFGAYKVNYDTHNWRLIIRALHNNVSSIHYLNRAQLLRDAFDNHANGRLDIDIVLELITYLRNEMDLLVWTEGKRILSFLRSRARGSDNSFKLFMAFQTYLIEPIYESFQPQIKPLPTTEPIYRWITNMACLGGIPHCLQATRAAFSNAAANTTIVPPAEMYTVYCFGMKNSTEAEFRWLLSRLKSSHDSKERDVVLSVLLVCTEQVDRVRTALVEIGDFFKEDGNLRGDLWSHIYNADFRVVEDKFQQIFELLGGDSEFMKKLGAFLTRSLIDLMERLIQTNEESSQIKLLVAKFKELFGANLSEEYMDVPKLTAISLVLEDYLQKFVSKIQ